jgi:uncharacterized protein YggE
LGLERGGSITLEFDDEVKILTVAARVRRAQALAKKTLAGKSISVDDILSYMREQFRLEPARMKRLEQGASIEDAVH